MPTKFEVTQEFRAAAGRVRAMMLDPDYVRERAERTGSIQCEANATTDANGTATMRATRALPTDQAPSFIKPLVGDAITVNEEQSWTPLVDGSCTATMVAQFGSMLSLRSTTTLVDHGSTTTASTAGELKASVPLISGKVEALVREQVERYLAAEVDIAADWLSR